MHVEVAGRYVRLGNARCPRCVHAAVGKALGTFLLTDTESQAIWARSQGALSPNAKVDRKYSERDLRAMSLYGEQAGAAILAARADESQRKNADQSNYQAMHDPLTGLPNRALLLDRVGNSLSRRRPPGHAVVLNTSLNRRGEPIACSPADALNIFFGSDLEYLIMEDVLVTK